MTELSVNECAERLGVSSNTVRRWIESGLFPFRRLSDGYRRPVVREETVDDLAAVMQVYDMPASLVTKTLDLFRRDPDVREQLVGNARSQLEEVA